MMVDSIKNLVDAYYHGCGYKRGDGLIPREGVKTMWKYKNNEVVVLDTRVLSPHLYTVLGESETFVLPEDRFIKTEINGHNWKKVRQV